eukprot:1926496-Rhodomonas_salina.3
MCVVWCWCGLAHCQAQDMHNQLLTRLPSHNQPEDNRQTCGGVGGQEEKGIKKDAPGHVWALAAGAALREHAVAEAAR